MYIKIFPTISGIVKETLGENVEINRLRNYYGDFSKNSQN